MTRLLAVFVAWGIGIGPLLGEPSDSSPPNTGVSANLSEIEESSPEDLSSRPGEDAGNSNTPAGDASDGAISSNPGAVNIVTGTGKLGEWIGFEKDSGVRLGGLWIGAGNSVLAGGLDSGRWAGNSLTMLDLTLDADTLAGIKGGLFGIEFLQYSGQPTNDLAGSVQGFNSLEGPPPLVRQELYELWWRQEFFDKRLAVRVGKSAPTYDFNNVSRPVRGGDPSADIPAVTGLIFTPVFVNPTLLGAIPGYYNTATGITTTITPNDALYFSYGFYDGNRATGSQTGLRGPEFDGHYFHIAETGVSYWLGSEQKPGMAAIGCWRQTGPLARPDGQFVNGAAGFYLFGSQRLWFRRPGRDNSGVSGYYQFGVNNSNAMLMRQYFGVGLTAFGLTPRRADDSFGFGLAWSKMNDDPNAGAFYFPGAGSESTMMGPNELMMAWYYQMNVRAGVYFQPTLSYIPNPGQRPDIPGALALTISLTLLF